MSSSMFFFLPIIVGFTAAKRLGADPIVVAIIGGVLCYPSVVDMSKNTDNVITVGRTVFNSDFFGIPVSLPAGNAYAYSIFPIIVAAWLASKIEPWLKKALPAVIRPIFGPLIEIFVVSALILLVFGPSDAAWVAFGYAIIWGLSAGPSAQAFYSVWSPELFATPYRSGAQGIVFFIVRMASGAISLIFPVILMKPNGLLIDGLILIGFLVAATLIGTIFAPRTQGKSLEQIEIERYGTKVTNTTATQ